MLFEFRADVQNLILTCGILYLELSICDLDELQIDDFGLDSIDIVSPNHPENYPDNEDCSIAIKVGAGRNLLLEILAFDVHEIAEICSMDFVQMYNGLPENSVMPQDFPKMCGNFNELFELPITDLTFSSTGNSWFIRLVTDNRMNAGTGFKFRFSSIRKIFILTIVPRVTKILILNLIG